MCGRIYGVLRGLGEGKATPHDQQDNSSALCCTRSLHSKSGYMAQHPVVMRQHTQLVEAHGEANWRVQGYQLLHQHWFILALAFLMVVDIIFMMADLVLSAFHPDCRILLAGVDCLAEPGNATTTGHEDTGVCVKECEEGPVSVEQAKVGMTIASLVILCIFLIELLFHMAIVGLRKFWSSIFLVTDLLIVLTSVGLEIYLLTEEMHSSGNNSVAVEASTVPLLIFARSWRILRIGHGSYKEAHDYYGERIRSLKSENAELKRRLREAGLLGTISSSSTDENNPGPNVNSDSLPMMPSKDNPEPNREQEAPRGAGASLTMT